MSDRFDSDNGCDILLVEDREADVELTRLALTQCSIGTQVHVVRDGTEASAFLRRRGKYESAPRPRLVLLDLNLPRQCGLEVLDEIKRDAELRTIPVVILTTSAADHDVNTAYAGHANAYLVKPLEFNRLVELLRRATEFWFDAAQLPPNG